MRVLIPGFFSVLLMVGAPIMLYAQYTFDFEVLKSAQLTPVSGLNTPKNESSPFVAENRLYFISDRAEGAYDVYTAQFDKGEASNLRPLPKSINSAQHEGPACWCNGHLYFSKSVKKKNNGIVSDGIQLMRATGDKFNSEILNPSRNLMHYTCYGRSSLGVELGQNRMTNLVRLDERGQITEDSELSAINSLAHDAFPVLLRDSVLVFSSKRAGGYGGFDLYITSLTKKGWSKPVLLPPPFNTSYDDVGMILFPDGRSGMLSSNRPGGRGGDDLYLWSVQQPFLKFEPEIPLAKFEVALVDKLSNEPVSSGMVKLYKVKDELSLLQLKKIRIENFKHDDSLAFMTISKFIDVNPFLLQPDASGKVGTVLLSNQNFVLEVFSATYERAFYLLTAEQWTRIEDLSLPLSPLDPDDGTMEGEDQAVKSEVQTWELKGIRFSESKINFSKDAQKSLDELVSKTQNVNDYQIEIISYTSAKQNSVQCLKTSTARAGTLKKWLMYKGLKGDQIMAKGGGDTKIINHCVRGVLCSEAEHSENERIVVELKTW